MKPRMRAQVKRASWGGFFSLEKAPSTMTAAFDTIPRPTSRMQTISVTVIDSTPALFLHE